jgi:hypothetical protein
MEIERAGMKTLGLAVFLAVEKCFCRGEDFLPFGGTCLLLTHKKLAHSPLTPLIKECPPTIALLVTGALSKTRT